MMRCVVCMVLTVLRLWCLSTTQTHWTQQQQSTGNLQESLKVGSRLYCPQLAQPPLLAQLGMLFFNPHHTHKLAACAAASHNQTNT